jgi:hypothetical protein
MHCTGGREELVALLLQLIMRPDKNRVSIFPWPVLSSAHLTHCSFLSFVDHFLGGVKPTFVLYYGYTPTTFPNHNHQPQTNFSLKETLFFD